MKSGLIEVAFLATLVLNIFSIFYVGAIRDDKDQNLAPNIVDEVETSANTTYVNTVMVPNLGKVCHNASECAGTCPPGKKAKCTNWHCECV